MRKKTKPKNAIVMRNIRKTYQLLHEKPTFIENIFSSKKREYFTALDGIDLVIPKGQKVGIIGENGAGKTTLLKVIAGITTADKGDISVEGRVVSLIDLTAGFHPDLTGEENIFLNAMLLGMSKKDVKKNLKKIIKFADIGVFIDSPLYTYSSGMKLRLGFSIAVHMNLDILILDEGISAGDENFREKASKKIKEFFTKGKTILVVSHRLSFLAQNCQRIIWMKKGTIFKEGNTSLLHEYVGESQRKTTA